MAISVKDEKVFLELNSDFYPIKIIDSAISLAEKMNIKKSINEKKITLEIDAEGVDAEELAREFSNFLLASMKSMP